MNIKKLFVLFSVFITLLSGLAKSSRSQTLATDYIKEYSNPNTLLLNLKTHSASESSLWTGFNADLLGGHHSSDFSLKLTNTDGSVIIIPVIYGNYTGLLIRAIGGGGEVGGATTNLATILATGPNAGSAGGAQINNLGTPSTGTDAANKGYVDTSTAGATAAAAAAQATANSASLSASTAQTTANAAQQTNTTALASSGIFLTWNPIAFGAIRDGIHDDAPAIQAALAAACAATVSNGLGKQVLIPSGTYLLGSRTNGTAYPVFFDAQGGSNGLKIAIDPKANFVIATTNLESTGSTFPGYGQPTPCVWWLPGAGVDIGGGSIVGFGQETNNVNLVLNGFQISGYGGGTSIHDMTINGLPGEGILPAYDGVNANGFFGGYLTYKNLTIINCGNRAAGGNTQTGVHNAAITITSHDTLIDNCTISNIVGAAFLMFLQDPLVNNLDRETIQNSRSFDCYSSGGAFGHVFTYPNAGTATNESCSDWNFFNDKFYNFTNAWSTEALVTLTGFTNQFVSSESGVTIRGVKVVNCEFKNTVTNNWDLPNGGVNGGLDLEGGVYNAVIMGNTAEGFYWAYYFNNGHTVSYQDSNVVFQGNIALNSSNGYLMGFATNITFGANYAVGCGYGLHIQQNSSTITIEGGDYANNLTGIFVDNANGPIGPIYRFGTRASGGSVIGTLLKTRAGQTHLYALDYMAFDGVTDDSAGFKQLLSDGMTNSWIEFPGTNALILTINTVLGVGSSGFLYRPLNVLWTGVPGATWLNFTNRSTVAGSADLFFAASSNFTDYGVSLNRPVIPTNDATQYGGLIALVGTNNVVKFDRTTFLGGIDGIFDADAVGSGIANYGTNYNSVFSINNCTFNSIGNYTLNGGTGGGIEALFKHLYVGGDMGTVFTNVLGIGCYSFSGNQMDIGDYRWENITAQDINIGGDFIKYNLGGSPPMLDNFSLHNIKVPPRSNANLYGCTYAFQIQNVANLSLDNITLQIPSGFYGMALVNVTNLTVNNYHSLEYEDTFSSIQNFDVRNSQFATGGGWSIGAGCTGGFWNITLGSALANSGVLLYQEYANGPAVFGSTLNTTSPHQIVTNAITAINTPYTMPATNGYATFSATITLGATGSTTLNMMETSGTKTNTISSVSDALVGLPTTYTLQGPVDAGYSLFLTNTAPLTASATITVGSSSATVPNRIVFGP